MEPVARRTRRRFDEALFKRYQEYKKSKTCSHQKTDQVTVVIASPPSTLGSSRSSSLASAVSASSVLSISANRSPVLRNVKTEEVEEEVDEDVTVLSKKQGSGYSFPLVVISSSSESEEEDLEASVSSDHHGSGDSDFDIDEEKEAEEDENGDSSSEGEEEEGGREKKYVSVEAVGSSKISSFGSIVRPIVLNADDDDEDDDGSESGFVKDDGIIDDAEKCTQAKHIVVDVDDDDVDDDDEDDGSESGFVKDDGIIDDAEKCTQAKHIVVDVDDVDDDDNVDDDDDEDEDDGSESGFVKDDGIIDDAEKCTQAKHIVVDVDNNIGDDEDEDEDEEEEEEEEEEVVIQKEEVKMGQQPKPLVRRGPMSADEIHQVLFNTILEEGNTDVVEDEEPINKPHETEETRSRSRSSSSDVDSGEETEMEMEIEDPAQEEIDSMYRMMGFYLVSDDKAAAEACLAGEDQEQLCNKGEHYLILDEEIGIICKVCGHVREEIKHVMPPFHENPFGVSDQSGYYTYDSRDLKNLPHFQDPSIEYQHFMEADKFDTTGTVWEIIPGLRDTMFPQQREAFEFIWRNVGGGTKLDELTSNGGGCLISHAPGTGKTRLSIAFLETYMKLFKNSRPVVLAPASILLSWKQEFEKWRVDVPFLNLNDKELSHNELSVAGSLFGRSYEKNLTQMAKRLIKLLYWKRHESVLAISYTLFTQLAGEDVKKQDKTKEMLRELLLETPGILILDEAHMPRNERSLMFKVLKEVKTKKRVLLSGTPFQNNFRELHNILCLVRKEFNDELNPFKKSGLDKSDEGKIRELKEKLKTFCHCCDNSLLLDKLHGLIDNNIYLQPSEHQKRLLKFEEEHTRSHFEANVNMTLISIHPLLLHCKDTNPDFTREFKSGRWDMADGAKTRFLIRLIQLSSALEERVLVFSQYLHPLKFLKALLQSGDFGWREGVEVHLMSGDQEMETRKRTMDYFNRQGSEAKVMLASTKACSEGIELTGASRVVLLDVTWNPSVEKQAISRAFRVGQRRPVHVYHLIMTDNDSNRHFSQNQKNSFSNYMFSLKSGAAQPEKPACEDVILERLREENIIQEATQERTCDRRPRNRF